MKYAVVTGATSFIGVYLVEHLLRNEFCVYAVVRPNSVNKDRLKPRHGLTFIEKNLDEYGSLGEEIDHAVDIFYHLTWDGARLPQRDNQDIQQKNYEGAIKAMEAAINLKCEVFLGVGSQAEYGVCSGKVDESHTTIPNTEYGKAKLKACERLGCIAKQKDIRFVWTRVFSVYGVHDNQQTLVMLALDKMLKDEPILLTACEQNWDFIYVEDVASAMYELGVRENCNGVYNIASGKNKTLRSFVEDMKFIANSQSELKFGALQYGSQGVIGFEPVIDKLIRDTDWRPQVTFEQGIGEILNSKRGVKEY